MQADYEYRVYYLYRLLSFHEWNQLEVERGDPLDRSGQRRRRISLAFLSLTRPAHHVWRPCCAPDLTRWETSRTASYTCYTGRHRG